MQNQPSAVFTGGSFRSLMRRYSNWRMTTDPDYKAAVHAAMEERRKAAAQKSSEVAK